MTKKKKTLIIRIILFTGTAISMFFVPWILVKVWILPLPATVQEQVDEAIGHGFDGMIVYVDQAGKPPEYYTSGWKDRGNKIPADPKSLFTIASISKLYTAVAATKLVKEKRLSFNKTLADYLPELRNRIEKWCLSFNKNPARSLKNGLAGVEKSFFRENSVPLLPLRILLEPVNNTPDSILTKV